MYAFTPNANATNSPNNTYQIPKRPLSYINLTKLNKDEKMQKDILHFEKSLAHYENDLKTSKNPREFIQKRK